jgi:hypothetical protein
MIHLKGGHLETVHIIDDAIVIIVCTENLTPHVVEMKSAKYGVGFDASGPLNWARDRRIFA